MPGTKSAIQRGTARAVTCTRDSLCGGEKADGCRATKRSCMPGPSCDFLFKQGGLNLIASPTEFESQSIILEKEEDMPVSHIAVWLEADEPDE